MHRTSSPRIAIIGAGLAGLTTAYRLQKLGFNPVVYEARQRVGGRVFTLNFKGGRIGEIGGENIFDGGKGTYIRALIQEVGLETEKNSFSCLIRYLKDGCLHNEYDLIKDLPDFDYQSKESSKNLAEILKVLLGDFPEYRQLSHRYLSCIEGSHPTKLDAFYLQTFNFVLTRAKEQAPRTVLSVKGGNSRLTEKLADALKNSIHFGKVLSSLDQSQDGLYSLGFEDGEKVEASYVVLALPLSILRDVRIKEGMLPLDQKKAVETQQYGTNAKILIPYQGELLEPQGLLCTQEGASWFNRKQGVITVYYGGEEGIFDHCSATSVCERLNVELPVLQQAYPDLTLNNLKASAVAYSWINDPFARGSYSNYGPGQYAFFNERIQFAGVEVRKVYRPVNQSLFFAGEHTALDYPATLEGAVASGERTATILSKIL